MLGLPDRIRACLFDLDGVLTQTAALHAAAWKEMFDAYLRQRAERTGQPMAPFDPVADYDTYVDGIESTKTDRYEVLDVKASADKSTARVTAKHVYNDPWGKRTSVNHSYFLVKEGSEYVIREFGTTGDHNAE